MKITKRRSWVERCGRGFARRRYSYRSREKEIYMVGYMKGHDNAMRLCQVEYKEEKK